MCLVVTGICRCHLFRSVRSFFFRKREFQQRCAAQTWQGVRRDWEVLWRGLIWYLSLPGNEYGFPESAGEVE